LSVLLEEIVEQSDNVILYCGAAVYLGEGISDTAKLISSDLIKNIEK
jgi:hypothetical protein